MQKLPIIKCLICGTKLTLNSQENSECSYICPVKVKNIHERHQMCWLNTKKQVYMTEYLLTINGIKMHVQVDNGLPSYEEPNGIEPIIRLYGVDSSEFDEKEILCDLNITNLTIQSLTDKINTLLVFS